LKDGRIQQVGTPLEVYGNPANKFVAGFIGAPSMNFIDVTLRGDRGGLRAETPFLSLALPASQAAALPPWRDKTVTMGVRPEHLTLDAGAPECSFDVGVEVVEQLGVEIQLETRAGNATLAVARVDPESGPAVGDKLRLSVVPGRLHFFDPVTETVIR